MTIMGMRLLGWTAGDAYKALPYLQVTLFDVLLCLYTVVTFASFQRFESETLTLEKRQPLERAFAVTDSASQQATHK